MTATTHEQTAELLALQPLPGNRHLGVGSSFIFISSRAAPRLVVQEDHGMLRAQSSVTAGAAGAPKGHYIAFHTARVIL